MFQKIERTAHPPKHKPIMIWDGQCGFCQFWITRWSKFTGSKIDYATYQGASADFPDINKRHFMMASRLIETDGTIYSGPRSAYRTFTYGSKWGFLDKWYLNKKWFTKLSDRLYVLVTKNRGFLFKVTKWMFGANPEEPRPFWAIYLAIIAYFIYI